MSELYGMAEEGGPKGHEGQWPRDWCCLGWGHSNTEALGSVLSVNLPGLLGQLVHSFMVLLLMYGLGYLGLIFSWMLLMLGPPT